MFPRLEKSQTGMSNTVLFSANLGAEHTIKKIMAGQTPLLSSSWGHKEQRGTITSYFPLPSSTWKLALRSAARNTTFSVLTVTCTQQDLEWNPIQKTISSKYWVMLSPIRWHVSMHWLEVNVCFIPQECNMNQTWHLYSQHQSVYIVTSQQTILPLLSYLWLLNSKTTSLFHSLGKFLIHFLVALIWWDVNAIEACMSLRQIFRWYIHYMYCEQTRPCCTCWSCRW